MKIKQLRLAGFGPYKDEQHVDFEAFDNDGIFLIAGKTGAGKSTILDAICYALFSAVPRYEETQLRLRSDHCEPDEPTWVELEFAVNDRDYKVRRTPEYDKPKQRGPGITRATPTAELSLKVGDAWESVAARPVDVGRELGQIIGLTKDQFLRVILLAQNRFHHFLQSNNNDRQDVLRTLFGTDRFRRVEEVLLDKRGALETELNSITSRINQRGQQASDLLGVERPKPVNAVWFTDLMKTLTDELAVASSAATAADVVLAATDAEYRQQSTLRGYQVRRDAAAARLCGFLADKDDIENDRATVKSAGRAAAVWPHVTAKQKASDDLRESQEAENTARTANPDRDATADTLRSAIDDTTRQLGSLEDAVAEEKKLPALSAEVQKKEELFAAAQSSITSATAAAELLPAQIQKQMVGLSTARIEAARVPAAEEAVRRLTSTVAAARSLSAIGDQLALAAAEHHSVSRDVLTATTRQHELIEQRLTGHAFELAGQLVSGEPCAVCGSSEHPAPAKSDALPVTADDIDTARKDVARLTVLMDTAKACVDELVISQAEARAKAGDEPFDELEKQLNDARQALSDALAAGARLSALEDAITSLNEEQNALRDQLAELVASLGAASSAVVAAKTVLDAAIARVEAQRGEFETVRHRHQHLAAHLQSAQNLATAITVVANHEAQLERAALALTAQLAEHDFADENAVEQARRTAAEIQAHQNRISTHDEGVATARTTLADPELVELPMDLIELDDTALAEAQRDRDTARSIVTTLTERAQTLTRIVMTASDEFAAAGAFQAEFDAINELAKVIHGDEPNTMRMKLESYVLAAQLEEIVKAANARLSTMTSGRYALQHDDSLQYRKTQSGLGLSILDEHTGRARPTHSLSGGETFLASLALALGLAEVVTNQAGGITLDTLFIDEGFGSLDTDTLEIAMSTLDSLRTGGRSIGLISHVGSMKEQIQATLQVRTNASGLSCISQSSAGAP